MKSYGAIVLFSFPFCAWWYMVACLHLKGKNFAGRGTGVATWIINDVCVFVCNSKKNPIALVLSLPPLGGGVCPAIWASTEDS